MTGLFQEKDARASCKGGGGGRTDSVCGEENEGEGTLAPLPFFGCNTNCAGPRQYSFVLLNKFVLHETAKSVQIFGM